MSDFVSVDALRLKAVAAVSWTDVDAACAEITWIKDAGFCGIVLPKFDPAIPLYSDVYEPIWALLEDLELVVHSHVASSSTTNLPESPPDTPHVGSFLGLRGHSGRFHCHAILPHLIWGGVLERHPRVTIVFTEQGSGWVRPMLADMDYTYEGSYLRSDTRDVIRSKPSEYFERQCYLGSSLFSKAEADARHDIGIDKMMLGADYPHHEGMLVHGVANYLQATFGAARVPLDDARMMLSVNAAKVYGFDLPALQPVADRIGLDPDVVLEPPLEELYPRGDVHKPLVA
jgi:predicted TIM-barrel fold metal-dependent hydrolase